MKLIIIFLLSFTYLTAQTKEVTYTDTTEVLISNIKITKDTADNYYIEFSKIKSIRVEDILEMLASFFKEELIAIRKQKFEDL